MGFEFRFKERMGGERGASEGSLGYRIGCLGFRVWAIGFGI